MIALSHDPSIGSGPDDLGEPTLSGGTLRVVTSADNAFDATYALPATGWKLTRNLSGQQTYRYTDQNLQAGPIRNVVVRDGKLLRLLGLGSGLDLPLQAEPDPTMIVLTLGERRYCMTFGGKATFHAERRYSAHDAPAPIACP